MAEQAVQRYTERATHIWVAPERATGTLGAAFARVSGMLAEMLVRDLKATGRVKQASHCTGFR